MFVPLWNFFRSQIGLKGDSSSATGTTHAKVVYSKSNVSNMQTDLNTSLANSAKLVKASDTLLASHDAEATGSGASYAQIKGMITTKTGVLRVKFDAHYTVPYAGNARIYINGTAVGTIRSLTSSYVTYSEDFTVASGDIIEVRGYCSSYALCYVRNFRFYGTTGNEGLYTL